MISKENKQEIINNFKKSENDTGSSEVQLGVLTARIAEITEHLRSFPKDFHSRLGLLKLVGRKRRLIKYLERKDKASLAGIMDSLESLKSHKKTFA